MPRNVGGRFQAERPPECLVKFLYAMAEAQTGAYTALVPDAHIDVSTARPRVLGHASWHGTAFGTHCTASASPSHRMRQSACKGSQLALFCGSNVGMMWGERA